MTDIYRDGTYADSNPTWHEGDAPWKARQIEGILRDNRLHPATVAEVGCGTGEILVQLATAFPTTRFSGYDISPQAHAMASTRSGPRLSFSTKDLVAERDEHFDVVVVADVVEHVPDCFGFVRGVRALGDHTVFHIPLDLSAQSVTRMTPILGLRASVGHIHYFTKDTALALLQECGFEVLDWRYTGSRLELPDQARSSRVVAPLRRWAFKHWPDLTVRVLGGWSLLVLAR